MNEEKLQEILQEVSREGLLAGLDLDGDTVYYKGQLYYYDWIHQIFEPIDLKYETRGLKY